MHPHFRGLAKKNSPRTSNSFRWTPMKTQGRITTTLGQIGWRQLLLQHEEGEGENPAPHSQNQLFLMSPAAFAVSSYCSQEGRGSAVKDFFHSFLLQKPFVYQGSRRKNTVQACNLRLCHYAYAFGTWINLHGLLFIGPEKTVILVITVGKELISAWILLLG